MTKWENITDVLTPEGIERLNTGEVLMFNYENSPIHLKIKRKSRGKVWAERIELLTAEQAEAKFKEQTDEQNAEVWQSD